MSVPYYVVRPTELPFHQRNLASWWQGEIGRKYAAGFIRSTNEKYDYRNYLLGGPGPSTQDDHPDYTRQKGLFLPGVTDRDLTRQESQRVLISTPYWISEEMMALAEHAALGMPPITFREEHVPTASGFMYLQAPRYTIDSRGKHVGERLIVWDVSWAKTNDLLATPKPGVAISWYSGRDDPDDDYVELRAAQDAGVPFAPFILLHVGFWPFGVSGWGGVTVLADGSTVDIEEHPEYDWRRFLASTWQLLQQSIVQTTRMAPSRHERRQMTRAKQPQHEVRVITLRRTTLPKDLDRLGDEHVPVNWRSRWVVRGHWRRLNHITREGKEVTWVNPYIKGPEDKPLIFSKDVYKLVR